MFFSAAFNFINSVSSSMLFLRLKGISSRAILPASIFEKSRMSLIIPSNVSADVWMVSILSNCSSFKSVSANREAIPITPFKGVRISWLIDAKNCDFDRAACSAKSLATVNSAVRCSTRRSSKFRDFSSCRSRS